jgi:hypothetical protein
VIARLSQAAAAEKLGINQPKVSALANYKLDGFSAERLMTFLTALDQDVEIVIKNSRGRERPGGFRWRRLDCECWTRAQLKLVYDGQERINQCHACTFEISGIARHHC